MTAALYAYAAVGAFCILILSLQLRRPRPVEPLVEDERCYLEKIGFTLTPGPATSEPGHDWVWVLKQLQGAQYWASMMPQDRRAMTKLRFRRKCWPVLRGLLKPSPWHIWTSAEYGMGEYYGLSWFQGWGNQIGGDKSLDDFVMVRGKIEYDGRGWKPSNNDIMATDWERLDD